MTSEPARVMVRRRSEPVEAVQWHPGVEHDDIVYLEGDCAVLLWADKPAAPGEWVVKCPDGVGYRVLTPEQFAEEYERVDAALGRDV